LKQQKGSPPSIEEFNIIISLIKLRISIFGY
jgi:hypothetical protein